ncbi:MAG: ATP-binding protein [Eubacteriales bacterium]|jgi:DNA polymerase-3 subunit delta'
MQSIAGNEDLLEQLRQQSREGRLSHGYVIEGPEGSGKRTLARWLAAMRLCQGETRPCGQCRHCRKVEAGIHPDIQRIAPLEGKASISIEQIKALRTDIYIAPNEADAKVYIIEDAHKMTLAAQNSLLKSLEEPPPFVMLVLCVPARDLLLPVILSRTVQLSLAPVGEETVRRQLEQLRPQAQEKERNLAAQLSGGLVGRGLELLDHPQQLEYMDHCVGFLEALAADDRQKLAQTVQWLEKSRDSVGKILEILRLTVHDAMLVKAGMPGELVHLRSRLEAVCGQMTLPVLSALYDQAALCESRLQANGNYNLTVNGMVRNCLEEMH